MIVSVPPPASILSLRKHKRSGVMADVFFKLGRKSTLYLLLLVIFATFTAIKDDKQFRFESTDVAELHVGKLVSQDCSQVSVRSRTKRPSGKIKLNCSPQLVTTSMWRCFAEPRAYDCEVL